MLDFTGSILKKWYGKVSLIQHTIIVTIVAMHDWIAIYSQIFKCLFLALGLHFAVLLVTLQMFKLITFSSCPASAGASEGRWAAD